MPGKTPDPSPDGAATPAPRGTRKPAPANSAPTKAAASKAASRKAAPTKTAADKSSTPAKSTLPAPGAAVPQETGVADTGPAAAEPVPLEVPLEEQITALPPLTYPGSTNEEFARWAAEKRSSRLRLEIIGGALLLILGISVMVVSGRPAFAVVALFGVAGLAAYEFLVSSFE